MLIAKSRPFRFLACSALVLGLLGLAPPDAGARSMIFGGGPFGPTGGGQPLMDTLRASGFTTIMIWSIHVDASGNLTLNDTRVVSNGQYVANSAWPGQLATLKQSPTSVDRIEISVGSAGVNDWHNIRDLINAQGTGSSSIL